MKLNIIYTTLTILLLVQCSPEQEPVIRNLEPENYFVITEPCRDTLWDCSIVQTPKETLIRFSRTNGPCEERMLIGFDGFDTGTHTGNLYVTLCGQCGSARLVPIKVNESIITIEEYGEVGQAIKGTILKEPSAFTEPTFEGNFSITRTQ